MKNKEKYDLKELKVKWLDREGMEIYADDGVYRMSSNSNAVLLRGLVNWLEDEYKEPPILDEKEREYLSAVIKPWRDRVIFIYKHEYCDEEYITIGYHDGLCEHYASFPSFKKGTMYKGMKTNIAYTLEELNI